MASISNPNSFSRRNSNSTPAHRPQHRKRVSALRLSSDTTNTLPEYIASSGWAQNAGFQQNQGVGLTQAPTPEDLPPDYPDSAEEADEDTDSEPNPTYTTSYTSLPPAHHHHQKSSNHPPPASPRKSRSRPSSYSRKKSSSSTDLYLDSLLERSVQALEMSNALLMQNSMPGSQSQTSLSTVVREDYDSDGRFSASGSQQFDRDSEGLSRVGSKRTSMSSGSNGSALHSRAAWLDDLDELSRGVDALFDDSGTDGNATWKAHHQRDRTDSQMSISSSLPSVSPIKKHRRRPSLDLNADDPSHLRFEAQPRTNLISPAPRALTQYVAASSEADSDTILLPSTLGLRSTSSSYMTQQTTSPKTSPLLAAPSSPKVTDRPIEPSTRAYNILSSFVYRPQAHKSASSLSTPSTPSLTSPSLFSSLTRRGSSNPSSSSERGGRPRTSPSRRSPEPFRIGGIEIEIRRSRSQTPKPVTPTPHHHGHGNVRPMTPPLEESSSSSRSDSDGCPAKQTVSALRKILDEQPPPPRPPPPPKYAPPQLLTPAPLAEATTSTATASISRLFTKGAHSSSARPPSPPKRTSLKLPQPIAGSSSQSSSSSRNNSNGNTPKPSPSPTAATHSAARNSLQIFPDLLTSGFNNLASLSLGNSRPGSGRSTPKRISFAELPESYAQTRPEGPSPKFQQKKNRKKHRRQGSGSRAVDLGSSSAGGVGGSSGGPLKRSRSGPGRDDGNIEIGGWLGWLVGGSIPGPGSSLRQEDRIEDRMNRGWGSRGSTGGGGYSSGMDDWTI